MASRRRTGNGSQGTKSSKTTTDHDEMRAWVEAHGGSPAHVESTGRGKDPGILRIDFPSYSGEGTLAKLDWEAWFDAFEKNKQARRRSIAKRGARGGATITHVATRSADTLSPRRVRALPRARARPPSAPPLPSRKSRFRSELRRDASFSDPFVPVPRGSSWIG